MKSAFSRLLNLRYTLITTHNVVYNIVYNVVQPTVCTYNVVHNVAQPTETSYLSNDSSIIYTLRS